MNNLEFAKMDVSDKRIVCDQIMAFYNEDPTAKSKTLAQVTKSCDWLLEHPQCGTIIVFKVNHEIIGYSILINFYSNEYGGLILNIDELYVEPEFRSMGIASNFIKFLKETNYDNFVALELEVLPYNNRALQLYEKIGFKKSDRSYLMLKK